LREVRAHRVGRDVRAAVDDLAIGGEERGRWPAAHVVAPVDVRTLVVIDAHRHESFVRKTDDFGIAVARLVHDVTPVAPHRADREKHRFVGNLRFLEGLLAPRSPCDLGGAVRARRETECHGISSSSILLPKGSNTYVRRHPGIGSASSKSAPLSRSVFTVAFRSSTRSAKCRRGCRPSSGSAERWTWPGGASYQMPARSRSVAGRSSSVSPRVSP